MNCFQYIALFVCLFGAPDEVITEVEMHLLGWQFKTVYINVNLVPASETFLDLYSEPNGFLFCVCAFFVFLDINIYQTLLGFSLWTLDLNGNFDCFFVEINFFDEREVVECFFQIYVDHKLAPFAATERKKCKCFELASYFVVHKHDELLEDTGLVAKSVLFWQVGLREPLLQLFFSTHKLLKL